MANVIKTVLTYNLNGSTRDFNIPFEYLTRKFVTVTLLGRDRKELVMNTDYRFATRTTISTTKAWGPADGYSQIEIRRNTSATERLVDFTDGSILRAYDLNVAQIQTMHIAEEARDLTADTIGVNNNGDLDARNRRIVNVANAVDDRDAVPYGQLKAMNNNAYDSMNKALQYRNEAQTFRNQAETFKNEANTSKNAAANSQNAAKTSETNAKNSENAALASKNAAAASQGASANSANAAKASENNAKASATRADEWANKAHGQVVADGRYSAKHYAEEARIEANKLGSWNALAGTIEGVSGTSVTYKANLSARGNLKTDGGIQIVEPASQGSGLSGDMVFSTALWRGATDATGVTESYLTYGSKRNDVYQYLWNDPSSWADGRSNGNGKHFFYGPANFNKEVASNYRFYTESTLGAGSLAGQLNDQGAYVQRLPGNQDGNTYYPMVKQFGRRSTGYPTAFSMGMVSMGTNAFHTGYIQLLGDNNQGASWSFSINGYFGTNGISSRSQIQSFVNGPAYLCQTVNNVADQACYVLGQAGGNNWYIGKGGAGNDISLHSYKHNTNVSLRAGFVTMNQHLKFEGGGNGIIARDGNIQGDKWGGKWLDIYLKDNFIAKKKAWTQVWAASGGGYMAGGQQTGTLSQDLRWRNIWIQCSNGTWNFFRTGPDGKYFIASDGGWLRFQIHSNGKIFKNVADSGSPPRAIVVENE